MAFPALSYPSPPPLLLLAAAVTTCAAVAIDCFCRRKPWVARAADMPDSISGRVYDLCHAPQSVSALLAEDPALPPADALKRLYSHHAVGVLESAPPKHRRTATPEELDRAASCGSFGDTRPSELFLRVWHDALCALEHDPLAGVVSPPLMGSSGVVPLSIISALPDICRHMVSRVSLAPSLFLTISPVEPHRQG